MPRTNARASLQWCSQNTVLRQGHSEATAEQGRQSKGILSFCLSKDEAQVSCGSHRASRMFSCIRRVRPLLLPTHWLALYSVSFCSHRNTLFSDITDLEQTLVSETLCPYPHPKSSGLTMLGEPPPTPTHDMRSCLSPVRLSVPGGLCWKTEVPCAGGGLTLIY